MHIDMLQKLIENLEKKIIQEKETEKKIYLILETIQYLDKKRENMSNYAKFKGMYNDPSDYDNDTKKWRLLTHTIHKLQHEFHDLTFDF